MEITTIVALGLLAMITHLAKSPLSDLQQKMAHATKNKWENALGNLSTKG